MAYGFTNLKLKVAMDIVSNWAASQTSSVPADVMVKQQTTKDDNNQ